MALSVDNLTVNTLTNPEGIDQSPTLGWKITSDKRGVKQTSYKINIYVNPEHSALLWSSGNVETDLSRNIKIMDFAMEPGTRYYWEVEITDNYGNTAISTENAYFTTGLMGNWSGAEWIKTSDYLHGYFFFQDIRNYIIETDVEIMQSGAGICFGKDDVNTYKMWHIGLTEEGRVWLTPQYWDKGNHKVMDKVDISELVNIKAGETFTLRLEICDSLKRCITYINNKVVDDRAGWFPYRQVGFRMSYDSQGQPESAYFDNIRVTNTATGEVKLHEDFTLGNSFVGATDVVDGRLMVIGKANTEAADIEVWQKTGRMSYSVDADITVVSGNPGLVFGWTANRAYFMWQIVTDGTTNPILRRNIRTFSDEIVSSDVKLMQFTNNEFIRKEHHWRIEVDYNIVLTYIDDQLVDTYVCNIRPVVFGCVGFGIDESGNSMVDNAYYDNIVVTQYYPNEAPLVVLDEDFESGWSRYFMSIETADFAGDLKCHINSSTLDNKIMQTYSNVASFYRGFNIDRTVSSAMLYTTALGVYDVWVNGERVGHLLDDGTKDYEEMKPGWTNYRKRVYYSTHDVTEMLIGGQNIIGAVVTSGWFNGNIARNINAALGSNAFLCKLVIQYSDGSVETIVTDESWLSGKDGPLMQSDIYIGECYDATRLYPWEIHTGEPHPYAVQIGSYPGIVEPLCGPHVRAVEPLALKPVSVTFYDRIEPGSDYGSIHVVRQTSGTSFELCKGETAIIDFGQNHAGVGRFCVKGKRGTRVRIRYAEMLNDSGDKSRGNDGPQGTLYRTALKNASQELNYTLSGKEYGELYQSNTTVSGYRYCEVTATEPVEFASFISLPFTSSYDESGTIDTDQPMVNRIFENARWGQLSNLLSIPTDCPNRSERSGWSGDTQIFSMTGMFNANVGEFYRKWLTDMRDCQNQDGVYCDIAPESISSWGHAGWADAGIIVSWNTYLMTGNKEVIAENYDAMEAWMTWMSKQKIGNLDYSGAGITVGDWLATESTWNMLICQAYYAYDAWLMANMSRTLSNDDNDIYAQKAASYMDLFERIKADYMKHFDLKNLYFNKAVSQTACILPLIFDLCRDNQQKDDFVNQLSEKIIDNGYRMSTGFLGTAYILQALSDNDHIDMAYNLLMQHKYPSWLYTIDQGGTTFWERWDSYTLEDGFGDASMNSFNHYAYGAVVEWLYRYMAGISPVATNPGFKSFELKPHPDMRKSSVHGVDDLVRHVSANYDSPYGRIISEWDLLDDESLRYHIRVPANTTARVYMPVKSPDDNVFEGISPTELSEGVEYIGYDNGYKIYDVMSGDYTFKNGELTSLSDIELKGNISVYPNPVTDILKIRTNSTIKRLTLLTTAGIAVKQYIGNQSQLDLSDMATGMYILIIDTESGTSNAKIIKQ